MTEDQQEAVPDWYGNLREWRMTVNKDGTKMEFRRTFRQAAKDNFVEEAKEGAIDV